jgi:hypothetical protein
VCISSRFARAAQGRLSKVDSYSYGRDFTGDL